MAGRSQGCQERGNGNFGELLRLSIRASASGRAGLRIQGCCVAWQVVTGMARKRRRRALSVKTGEGGPRTF